MAVSLHPGNGRGQRVGIRGVDQQAGVAHHLGQRTGVIGHDRQSERHGLEHRHAEALVAGGDHQHIGAGHGGHELLVAHRAEERDRIVEAHLIDEALQGRRVGRDHRATHQLERRRRIVVGARHEERHHGQLDGLVRGESPHADPPGAARRRRRPRASAGPQRRDRRGRHDRRATEACRTQLRLVEGRHRQTERAARRQLAQLRLRRELVPCHAVVPGGVVLGRRDVVVVHHQRFRARPEPRGDARRRGELVEQDVARLGLLRIAGERPGLRLRVGVGHLDVEVRADPAPGQDLAQPQRVPSDGIGPVQHRDELVHRGHEGRAPRSVKGTRRLTKRSAAAGRSSSASRRRPAATAASRRSASARNALMDAASA